MTYPLRLVAIGLLFASCAGCRGSAAPCGSILRAPASEPESTSGWALSGGARDSYSVHRDVQGGRTALVLEPARDTLGMYGTWMRHIDASPYRGKRARIIATVKTTGATKRVDFWARAQAADSPGDGPGLGGDSQNLPQDSDWKQQTIVMDVPANAAWLEYGVGVAGPGKIWLEGAKLEIVGADVALTGTDRRKSKAEAPSPVRGWMLAGDDVPDYAIAVDTSVKQSGRASGSLYSRAPQTKGFGTLMQSIGAETYQGKRLKLSAAIRARDVGDWAGLWMRVDGPSGRRAIAFDNMQDRPIKGTTDWTRYDIVLDVAADAAGIAFGVLLSGGGQVWIDDVTFDVVPNTVPTTGAKGKKNLDFEQ